MRIETSSGHTILADDADEALLAAYGWYVNRTSGGRLYAYARVRGTGKRISMHRLVMAPPPGKVVHHKNNDGLDNRRSNLEVTTSRQNTRYHYDPRDGGVHFHKQTGKWRAQLRNEFGKFISLGLFHNEADAREAARKFKETRL